MTKNNESFKPVLIAMALLMSSLAYAYTTTNSMNLRIPATGDHDYPTSISDSFTLIDAHDHTSGKGVQIPAGGLGNNAVTTANILDANVTADKIADLNVTTGKIADLGVTTAKIANDNVVTSKILDANVTSAKLASNLNLAGSAVQENGKNLVVSNTNTTNSLAMVRGRFNSTTVLSGEGFTITRLSAGNYTVNFSTAFTDLPTVVASAQNSSVTGYYFCNSMALTSSTASIQVRDGASGFVDIDVSFIAIGQRL